MHVRASFSFPPKDLRPRLNHHDRTSRAEMASASTSYKKQDGTFVISKAGAPQATATWTPAAPPGSAPSLRIAVGDITSKTLNSPPGHDDEKKMATDADT